MKKQVLTLVTMLTLVTAIMLMPAHASSRGLMTVKIPFNFFVRDKALPAGQYTIRIVNSESSQALSVRSADGRLGAMTHTLAAQSARVQAESRLVFNLYGDRYYLSQVWTIGGSDGYGLSKSENEERLAKSFGPAEHSTVSITARPR
jgi:hypothetical protein